ncbi:MAG: hypothetical protein IKF56_01805 [Eggerthellaceae bacterium]|nr:hypothetical protein [Eggerthellaceae bacterium]
MKRGIIAAEGTIKTLSPNVNILNYFIDKVDIGIGFDLSNLDADTISDALPTVVMELLKFFDSTSRSTAKTAETLDMLEKGQIQVRTNIGIEDKALDSIERLVRYAIRGLLIVVFFVGSCVLCLAPPFTLTTVGVSVEFPVIGFVGYILSVILAFFLYRGVKKRK